MVKQPEQIRFADAPSRARRLVHDGDTIVSTVRTYLRAVWPVRGNTDDLVVSTGFAVLTPTAVYPRYFSWWVISDTFIEEIVARSVGVSYPAINASELGELSIRVPSSTEQRAIADHLDSQTSRIDLLISKKHRLVEVLKENIRALRDEWFWRSCTKYGLVALRRWISKIEQGWSPVCDSEPAKGTEWGVIKTSAVSSGDFVRHNNKRLPLDIEPDMRWMIQDGDLLVTRGSGSRSKVGKACIANVGRRNLTLSDLVYRLHLRKADAHYVAESMSSSPVRAHIEASIRTDVGQTLKVRRDDLALVQIPAVPYDQQPGRVLELAEKISPLHKACLLIERQITTLAERRQALITDAVTGQLTCHEWHSLSRSEDRATMTAMQDDNPFRADADPWPTLDAAVQEAGVVADRARAFYGDRLKSVWLYGSRARQDNRPDSDLDVLLVRESPPGLDPTEDTTDLYDPTFRDLIEQERDYYSVLIWPIQIKSARPEQWETWDTMFFRAAREDAIRIL